MNKIYILLFTLLLLFSSCSKDFLKRYEERIDGQWELVDIDRRGIGNSSPMPVQVGDRFAFGEDGSMVFTRNTGEVYDGTWDIRREWNRDGNRVKTLYLVGIDFNTQDVFSIYFDEMIFTGTNRFKGFIYDGWKTYVLRFKR